MVTSWRVWITGCRWTGRWGCRWARQPHLGWRTAGGVPGHRDQPTAQGEDSDEDAEGRDKPVGLPGRFGSWHRDGGLGQGVALALTEPLHRVSAGRRLLLGGTLTLPEPLHRVTAGGLCLRDGGHTQAHSPQHGPQHQYTCESRHDCLFLYWLVTFSMRIHHAFG